MIIRDFTISDKSNDINSQNHINYSQKISENISFLTSFILKILEKSRSLLFFTSILRRGIVMLNFQILAIINKKQYFEVRYGNSIKSMRDNDIINAIFNFFNNLIFSRYTSRISCELYNQQSIYIDNYLYYYHERRENYGKTIYRSRIARNGMFYNKPNKLLAQTTNEYRGVQAVL